MSRPNKMLIKKSTDIIESVDSLADKVLIKVNPNARLRYWLLPASSNQSKEIVIELDKGSILDLFGLVLALEEQKIKLKIILKLAGCQSQATVKLRSLLSAKASFVCYSLIKIYKSAQKSISYLEVKNLSIDSAANCQVEPQLEIEANNVKASHAFSQGQIDQEQIFYLQSRGLTVRQAKKLIIRGFITEVMSELPNNEMSEIIRRFV